MQSTASPADPSLAAVPLSEEHRTRVAARLRERVPERGGVYALVAYHLGWRDAAAPCSARAGKMLRPSLLLTVGEGYVLREGATDAAAALELLHAFSLVHDDIEDGDRQRRHRPTLWALHGVPLALNAGDSLFALAQRTMIDAAAALPRERGLAATRIFIDAGLRMIEGQHDDLSYEARTSVTRDEYLRMTAGKTGALIGASLALGALFGGAPEGDVDTFGAAGEDLGIAFQCVDDALGVWGDPARTGKAAGADAARGKKSLPAIVAAELGWDAADARVRHEVDAIAAAHGEAALAAMRATSIARDAMRRLEDITAYVLRREE
jgi:geranylgeranyl diphosphate synthase type I